MPSRDTVLRELRTIGEELLAFGEMLGYVALAGAMIRLVATSAWYDAVLSLVFVFVMVGRRLHRWLDR